MYHKIARGHATSLLQRSQSLSAVEAWCRSPRRNAAVMSFAKSSRAKKPGRCMKRVVPHLKPVFHHASIGQWDREMKSLSAYAIGTARESAVLDAREAPDELFRERAVFMTNFSVRVAGGDVHSGLRSVANISHHAIARMVEREVVEPGELRLAVRSALNMAWTVAQGFSCSDLDPDAAYSFLVPFGNGALPIGTMHARPESREDESGSWVMSVRTCLGAAMIGSEEARRMEGFREAAEGGAREDVDPLVSWVEKNARPWLPAWRRADAERRVEMACAA